MPHAVTHVLLTIICVDLYRDYILKSRKYFTLHTVFIAGFAGLLPDIDMVFRIFAKAFEISLPALLDHKGITHTPLFGLLFLIPGLVLWRMKKKKFAVYCFVAVFGILFHVLLDFLLASDYSAGIMLLFPFSMQTWKLGLLPMDSTLYAAIDAVILLGWLWHEEMKHKIIDYI
jgi:membrane-bound metal-dependent hydrolase YbcI (DUF457 family)